MNKSRMKFFGILTLISFILSLCMKTLYSEPLGDIILVSIGLKSWSGGSEGLHLTVVYCVIIGIIIYSAYERKNEPPSDVGVFKKLLYIFIVATFFVAIFNSIAEYSLRYNDGLKAVEFLSEGTSLSMDNGAGTFDFSAKLTLKNHGAEEVSFNVIIEHPIDDYDSYIYVNDFDGSLSVFTLPPKSTITLYIDDDKYLLEGDFDRTMGANANSRFPIILTDLEGVSHLYGSGYGLGEGISWRP